MEKVPEGNENEVQEKIPGNISSALKRRIDSLMPVTSSSCCKSEKVRVMFMESTNVTLTAYQRLGWQALEKSIIGYVSNINISNFKVITQKLLRENIVRGRGLLANSIIKAQAASPTLTPVFAALTAIINSKFPNIGELIIIRAINRVKTNLEWMGKNKCKSAGIFIAHLTNHRIVHESLVIKLLMFLLAKPSENSVEIAIAVLEGCGQTLVEISNDAVVKIFECLKNILDDGKLDKKIQDMIKVVFQARKDGFKDHVSVPKELDLLRENERILHLIKFEESHNSELGLNYFLFDLHYFENEKNYKAFMKEILDSDDSYDSDEEDDSSIETPEKEKIIMDKSETNLVARRKKFFQIMESSFGFEECLRKLMKMQLKSGNEREFCHMLLECCTEIKTYNAFHGFLAVQFCAMDRIYAVSFEELFTEWYGSIRKSKYHKSNNLAIFFAHLLITDSISWTAMSCIRLGKSKTSSSSRTFIKILLLELIAFMGFRRLIEKMNDVKMTEIFKGFFPKDSIQDTKFAVQYFNWIGLRKFAVGLVEHLKAQSAYEESLEQIDYKFYTSSSQCSSSELEFLSDSSSFSSAEEEFNKKINAVLEKVTGEKQSVKIFCNKKREKLKKENLENK